MSGKQESWPLFSIIVPVYNRSAELARALASVRSQTDQDFEVLVVDDGSDVEYAAKIAASVNSSADERIRLIRYPDNRNGAHARNVGIRSARGHYVCFLDSDDEWHVDKLAKVRRALGDGDSPTMLYHQYRDVRDGAESSPLPPRGIRPGQSVADYSFCQNRGGGIQSSCLCVERTLAQRVLFNEQLRGHQDWDFVLRLGAETNDIGFIAEPLTRRHITSDHGNMVSRSLSYNFSLQFLRDYERYFSHRAKAAYAAFVLEPRRRNSTPRAAMTRYQWLAWLHYPQQCLRERDKQRKLDTRCRRLTDFCRTHHVKSVCLMGYNDYTRALLAKYARLIPVSMVLDRYKRATLSNGLSVRNVNEISPADWDDIDLVVTVTDHHHESMRADLAGIDNLHFYTF